MTRSDDRAKALELRKQGMSYGQIKNATGAAKSTLSYWLRDLPLSKKRIRELRDGNGRRIERFRETMRRKKEVRLNGFYQEQKKQIFPLTKRELFLAGLFLYWGEGSKSRTTHLSVSNTDPSMMRFFIKWLTFCLNVPKEKLSAELHLYQDMDIDKEHIFWSKNLKLALSQFIRPYIKETYLTDINHKGGFGHGTCNVRINDARLSEKILMGLKAVSHKY